ncbi:branched-chain amino acid ABC transporter permease [Desulfovirgula thermocuniculi]|uniref:branched-chain amino acid ABC transporter permease n=1 Tax=Desulfovirgula thermocuniculi TaxID=348842 RepID=UPI000484B329|nr:branched-chain amino acid ABC transporter permease [Desulfovirgula thermocuniculi]
MQEFLQQVVNGLTIGSIYALVALGYTMVYGILKLINFAHGELFMIGSFLAFTLIVSANLMEHIPHPVAGLVAVFLLVALMVAVIGLILERVAYRPLRRSSRLAPLVSALGASIFLQNAIMLVYGGGYLVFPENLVPNIEWSVGGINIGLMRVIILALSISLMLFLYLLVQKTRLGAAMRACSLDHDTARLMGINVDRIIALVFVIGPALGAIAGIMVGMYYRQINFTMGWAYGLRAFTAAILGGIGNIPGAMVGGLLLGILETIGAGYVAAAWKDVVAFIILILILILRPTGLLGERVAEKV